MVDIIVLCLILNYLQKNVDKLLLRIIKNEYKWKQLAINILITDTAIMYLYYIKYYCQQYFIIIVILIGTNNSKNN